MIHYKEYPPSPILKSFVECYWVMETKLKNLLRRELIIPGGRAELIFNLAGSLTWFSGADDLLGTPSPTAFLLGPRNKHFFIGSTGEIFSLGIRFRPGGLAQFTNIPVNEFINSITPLPEVFKKSTATCDPLFSEEGSLVETINTVEKFLIAQMGQREDIRKPLELIAAVRRNVDTSVKDICDLTGVHYKKMERIFLSTAGYTPKNFARVMRFYRSLREMKKTKSLTHAGLESGYYDQSHFIKDFREFAGTSPAEFIADEPFIPEMLLRSVHT